MGCNPMVWLVRTASMRMRCIRLAVLETLLRRRKSATALIMLGTAMAAITVKMPTTASNSIIEKPELVVRLLFFISSTFPHNTDELRPAHHRRVKASGEYKPVVMLEER